MPVRGMLIERLHIFCALRTIINLQYGAKLVSPIITVSKTVKGRAN